MRDNFVYTCNSIIYYTMNLGAELSVRCTITPSLNKALKFEFQGAWSDTNGVFVYLYAEKP